jgi:hypothetical protein
MIRSAITIGLFLALALQSANSNHGATPEALIQEVRQLRTALERAIAIAPRVQLMMWRVGVQDQRVQRLSERLASIQESLSQMHTERDRHLRMVRDQEERLATEKDPGARRGIEAHVHALKQQSELYTEQETQLRHAEAEVSSNLRREQALLDDLVRQTEAVAETTGSPR